MTYVSRTRPATSVTSVRHRITRGIAGGALFAIALPGAPAIAQTTDTTPASPAASSPSSPRSFCFRPTRAPRCRSYLALEMVAVGRLAGTTSTRPSCGAGPFCRQEDLRAYLGGDIGWMRNVDSTRALGVSLQIGGSEDGVRVALRARRRQWLPHHLVFDLAAGPLTAQQQPNDNTGVKQSYGFTAESGVGVSNFGTLVLAGDVTRRPGHSASALHGGARLESWPAVIGGAVVVAGLIALYSALKGGF